MSRGGRRLRSALILLIAVLAVLAIADRVAVRAAQGEIERRLVERAEITGGDVDVSIHGFPFLTQVASGRYRDIAVEARGVTLQDVRDVDLSARLRGVELSLSDLRGGGRPPVPVDSVDGHVVVPYTELARRGLEAGAAQGLRALSLSGAGDDVAVSATVEVLAFEVQGRARAGVSIADGAAHLRVGDIEIQELGGNGLDPDGLELPGPALTAVTALMNEALEQSLALPSLPYGLRITSAVAQRDGLRINAAASDVTL